MYFVSNVVEISGGSKVDLKILFRFQLTANQDQDSSCELKVPEILESFSCLILEILGLLFFILKKLSLAEEDNHVINMTA